VGSATKTEIETANRQSSFSLAGPRCGPAHPVEKLALSLPSHASAPGSIVIVAVMVLLENTIDVKTYFRFLEPPQGVYAQGRKDARPFPHKRLMSHFRSSSAALM
jgi:hypothetical protein